jgi:hypothetical protein
VKRITASRDATHERYAGVESFRHSYGAWLAKPVDYFS